jgi:hypothetical protein
MRANIIPHTNQAEFMVAGYMLPRKLGGRTDLEVSRSRMFIFLGLKSNGAAELLDHTQNCRLD